MVTTTTLPAWIKEGARLRLIEMPGDPCPVEPGRTGTIKNVVELSCIGERGCYQLWVDWDGERRGLMVLWPEDNFEQIL